ncbi:MAG: cytidine deaminase [Bacteroidales bacterium]|jgi:cytidine deaminase|nr:cytidine deaminase [Bacteroidales bacterium]
MNTEELRITFQKAADLQQLGAADRTLLTAARAAVRRAYAPYSGYSVGAAVLLDNGQIFTGNNQENVSFPAGVCAERVALSYANANFPDSRVVAVAISAVGTNGAPVPQISPCGICRQVLHECEMRFGRPVRLILDGTDSLIVVKQAADLLPLSFVKLS